MSSYKAFITYSHEDSKLAAWLQRKLESYSVPSRLVGRDTPRGKVPARLRPIFRDREELSAGSNLGEAIVAALGKSEFLICICSPAARASEWVNQEISEFRRLHGDDRIICVIAGGEPGASNKPGREAEECFPAALGIRDASAIDDRGVEHVAADMRRGTDGRKSATLKIIAGLIGVGLDDLVQRDAQRRMVRMVGLSLFSLAGMIAMSIMAFIAIEARNAEEQRRSDAEDLIEFMLTDLRDQLEPVGRLDAMDAVGKEAIKYYSKLDLADHTIDSLGRRARAFHLLGEVDDLRGDTETARDAFTQAYESTGELLKRFPRDGQRVYDHAQSVFWVGYLDWRLGNYDGAQRAFMEYVELADTMNAIDPENVDWLAERGHANINMGVYTLETGTAADAIAFFDQAQAVFAEAADRDPGNTEWMMLVAQAHAWSADANEDNRSPADAGAHRSAEARIYEDLLAAEPDNRTVRQRLIASHHARADIALDRGDVGEVLVNLNAATSYGEELVELDPDNTLTTFMTATSLLSLAEAEFYADRSGAREHLSRAVQMVGDLLEKDSGVLEWQVLEAQANIVSAWHLSAARDQNDALTELADIEKRLGAMQEDSPDAKQVSDLRIEAWHYLANVSAALDAREDELRYSAQVAEALLPSRENLAPRYLAILAAALERSGNDDVAGDLRSELAQMEFAHPEFAITSP